MNNRIAALKPWVPNNAGLLLYLLFVFTFQFSNGVYMSLLGEIIGANQFYREDLSYAFQASMVGMCVVFPLLFRFKFRYLSQEILLVTSGVTLVLILVSVYTTSIPVLVVAGFFIGAFKMVGTFESFSSIQLIITPSRDFGIFFSVVYTVVLLSVQLSGLMAVYLTDHYNWQLMYYIMSGMLGLQILLVLVFLRPIRVIRKLPLVGIDWKGLVLWSMLLMTIAFVAAYGQLEDWLASEKIIYAAVLIGLLAPLVYLRTVSTRRAYILPVCFKFRNVNISVVLILLLQIFLNTSNSILSPFTAAIMKLDRVNTINLNWWVAAGILLAAVFSLVWFTKINGPFRWLFALGFTCLTLYHGLLFFCFSSAAGKEILGLPYMLRGFGNLVIYVGVAKYMMKDVSFPLFPQALFIVGLARNAIGGTMAGAAIGDLEHHKVMDYLQKLAAKTDAVTTGHMPAGALYGKFYLQSLLLAGRDIFGLVTVMGMVIVVGIIFYHFQQPFVRRMPGWNYVRKMKFYQK